MWFGLSLCLTKKAGKHHKSRGYWHMTKKISVAEIFEESCGQLDLKQIMRDAGVENLYISVITGRCGSTLIANFCDSYGFGQGREPFNERAKELFEKPNNWSNAHEYFVHQFANYKKGNNFYFQITPTRLMELSKLISLASISEVGTGVSKIFRRDVFSQALSYYNAVHTGLWHASKDKSRVVKTEGKMTASEIVDIIWIRKRISLILSTEQLMNSEIEKEIGCSTCFFYEDIVDNKFASFYRFLKGYGVEPDLDQLRNTVTSQGVVGKLERPNVQAQYYEMATKLPGVFELLEMRSVDPLSEATYDAFRKLGY
jgi:hypothetical protein